MLKFLRACIQEKRLQSRHWPDDTSISASFPFDYKFKSVTAAVEISIIWGLLLTFSWQAGMKPPLLYIVAVRSRYLDDSW